VNLSYKYDITNLYIYIIFIGIILGSNIRRWSPSFTIRLSDVLSQYYSEEGVTISGEQNFRSCDRSGLFAQSAGANLEEQSRSFAALYNNRTNELSDQTLTQNPNIFNNIVQEAYQRMLGVTSKLHRIIMIWLWIWHLGPCANCTLHRHISMKLVVVYESIQLWLISQARLVPLTVLAHEEMLEVIKMTMQSILYLNLQYMGFWINLSLFLKSNSKRIFLGINASIKIDELVTLYDSMRCLTW